MAMSAVQVLNLPPTVGPAVVDQMRWVLLAQDGQGGVEFVLLDVAMRGQVLARDAAGDQVFA